jgi:hypothetical protein
MSPAIFPFFFYYVHHRGAVLMVVCVHYKIQSRKTHGLTACLLLEEKIRQGAAHADLKLLGKRYIVPHRE